MHTKCGNIAILQYCKPNVAAILTRVYKAECPARNLEMVPSSWFPGNQDLCFQATQDISWFVGHFCYVKIKSNRLWYFCCYFKKMCSKAKDWHFMIAYYLRGKCKVRYVCWFRAFRRSNVCSHTILRNHELGWLYSNVNIALWWTNRHSCFHKLSRPSKCLNFNVGYLLT